MHFSFILENIPKVYLLILFFHLLLCDTKFNIVVTNMQLS